MRNLRRALHGAAMLLLIASGSFLHAQSSDEPGEETPEVDVAMDKSANLSPEDMQDKAKELFAGIKGHIRAVEELKAQARKQKDILKVNCINDKLRQLRELLQIADTSMTNLVAAIATHDEPDRYHRFSMITISSEKARGLHDEAEACVGEELVYLGPSDTSVDQPEIPDDPTDDDPFYDEGIEPPGYASPFE
jgi:hypothetical protein